MLVFYHTVPPLLTRMIERAFIVDAGAAFGGAIRVSQDGDRISLPAGLDAIAVENLL
jgi:hypothetical protein